ncbi:hypothetical protein E3A20_29860, partial [Planctomyces bekefii]
DDVSNNGARIPEIMTEVRVFDTAAGTLPTFLFSKTYPGYALDTRRVKNHLILVFADYLWVQDGRFESYGTGFASASSSGRSPYSPWIYSYREGGRPSDRPLKLDGADKIRGVGCTTILKSAAPDFDFRMTRVVSMNTKEAASADQSTAVLGGGDQIYMSERGIYLSKSDVSWYGWDETPRQSEPLLLTRIAFDGDSGAIAPVAYGVVQGRVKDQWAFKEFEGHDVLSVATSTGYLWGQGENVAQNHRYVLKTNLDTHTLDVAAKIENFGTGEDIRAIRYVDSMAYVVTFKKTDPLFAFNLADPLHPVLESELKIPGFSVYMHPVNDQKMIGVGFDAADQGDFAWFQ